MNLYRSIRIGLFVVTALPAGWATESATTPKAATVTTAHKATPAPNKFDALKIGMPQAQVLAILGQPESKGNSEWGYGRLGWIDFSVNNVVSRIRKGEPAPPNPAPNLSVSGLSPSGPVYYAPQQTNPAIVYVHGYQRNDGTWVAPHYRTAVNGVRNDNYSTRGNVNPYTGEIGTEPRDGEGAVETVRQKVENDILVSLWFIERYRSQRPQDGLYQVSVQLFESANALYTLRINQLKQLR